jgi:hypothetical protein
MNSAEAIAVLEQIQRRFSRIGKRFGESPALLQDWLEAIKDFNIGDVEAGIRDWVWTHNSEPTLKSLVDNVEKVQKQNKAGRRQTGGASVHEILQQAADRQIDPMDVAWANLHAEIVIRGKLNKPTLASRQAMADMYREVAKKIPELKADCLREAEKCVLEAAKLSVGGTHASTDTEGIRQERPSELQRPEERLDKDGPYRGIDGGIHSWDQPIRDEDGGLDEIEGDAGLGYT